jgi:hypothetical protein
MSRLVNSVNGRSSTLHHISTMCASFKSCASFLAQSGLVPKVYQFLRILWRRHSMKLASALIIGAGSQNLQISANNTIFRCCTQPLLETDLITDETEFQLRSWGNTRMMWCGFMMECSSPSTGCAPSLCARVGGVSALGRTSLHFFDGNLNLRESSSKISH